MKEYRVDVRLRNNLLLKRIEGLGYLSLADFCRANNLSYQQVVQLASMRTPALKKTRRSKRRADAWEFTEEFRKVVVKVAEALGCDPEDLFTFRQKVGLELTTSSIEISENDALRLAEGQNMDSLPSPDGYMLPPPDMSILAKKLSEQARRVLTTLTPREEKILRMRFGIGEKQELTQKEVGEEFEVTAQTISRIEFKALRKLRHPCRAEKLRPFKG